LIVGVIITEEGHVTTYRHALLYCLSVTNDRKNLSNASVHVWVGVKWTRKQSDSCWSDNAMSIQTHKDEHITQYQDSETVERRHMT